MAEAPITGESYPGVDTALGFIFSAITAEEVTASLTVGPEHLQPEGIVHGGVYAALAESIAGVGSHTAVGDSSKVAMGMSNNTTFLRSLSDGSIHAKGKPIHRGRTTWIWDIEMTNDDGKVCAVSRVTIAIRDAR